MMQVLRRRCDWSISFFASRPEVLAGVGALSDGLYAIFGARVAIVGIAHRAIWYSVACWCVIDGRIAAVPTLIHPILIFSFEPRAISLPWQQRTAENAPIHLFNGTSCNLEYP